MILFYTLLVYLGLLTLKSLINVITYKVKFEDKPTLKRITWIHLTQNIGDSIWEVYKMHIITYA